MVFILSNKLTIILLMYFWYNLISFMIVLILIDSIVL